MARYHGKAEIDANSPRAVGICDKCGFYWNLYKLRTEFHWAGAQLVSKNNRVCPTCFTESNPNLRTVILDADPLPVRGARPANLDAANIDYLTTEIDDALTTEGDDNLIEDIPNPDS